MTDHINKKDGFWVLTASGFKFIFDGTDVLLIKMLQCHESFFPLIFKLIRNLNDNTTCLIHVFAIELETEGDFLLIGFVENELTRGNNTIGTFLLKTRKSAKRLVGNILP